MKVLWPNITFYARSQKFHLQNRSAAEDIQRHMGHNTFINGQYRMFWPCPGERANVVIELFVIYESDYSSYNGSFWCSEK